MAVGCLFSFPISSIQLRIIVLRSHALLKSIQSMMPEVPCLLIFKIPLLILNYPFPQNSQKITFLFCYLISVWLRFYEKHVFIVNLQNYFYRLHRCSLSRVSSWHRQKSFVIRSTKMFCSLQSNARGMFAALISHSR